VSPTAKTKTKRTAKPKKAARPVSEPSHPKLAALPRARVDSFVSAGQGKRFDRGHGRVMKEWLVMHDVALDWTQLAREAQVFREQREQSR
jgi:hypothetical protein